MKRPTIHTDARQLSVPGTAPSAVQAQAARDAGRGTLRGRVAQLPPDFGLFSHERRQKPLQLTQGDQP